MDVTVSQYNCQLQGSPFFKYIYKKSWSNLLMKLRYTSATDRPREQLREGTQIVYGKGNVISAVGHRGP